MERETGIEPATNSLEGCDSTTELLPPSRLARCAPRRYGGQARQLQTARVASRRFGGQARLLIIRLLFVVLPPLTCHPKLRAKRAFSEG